MITEAQIVLFRFPQTDQTEAKLRPAVLPSRLPGHYDDWMICMISSQLHQQIPDFDEVITSADSDFHQFGLKLASVIRMSRLAVVNSDMLLGKLGQIDVLRLSRIKQKLASWIQEI
jgi:mRNA interferase MazF